MAEELTVRSGALIATVISVKMEIDDDDRDVIEAEIEVSNEAGIPMGQLEPVVETTEGSTFHSLDPISSIGPGLSRLFIFNFSLPGGEWTFKLWHETAGGRKSLDLGPYHSEYELKKKEIGRQPKTSMGEGLFGGAFNMGMDDFGNISERGFIDSTNIELVEYEAEHDAGGGTKINVSSAEEGSLSNLSTVAEEPTSSSLTDSPPAQPFPMNQALNAINSAPSSPPSGAPSGPPTPPAVPPEGAPSSAPSGPPDVPPSGAPSGPPSGAPSGPPTPPAGPPTPPATPPATPPEEAPSSASSGPPDGPPTGAPSGPPTGAPSGPPSGAPSGPPSSAPSGPPDGPPSGPQSDSPASPPSGPSA